jgi:single-strand DNA-binding protein
MTMHAVVIGRLARDPQTRETKAGAPMASAFVFATGTNDAAEGIEGRDVSLGVVAFGTLAEELARYRKGETVRLGGTVTLRAWKDPDGTVREQLNLRADSVAGVRRSVPVQDEMRPKPRKARDRVGGRHGHGDVQEAREVLDGGPGEGAGGGLDGVPF